MKIYISILLLFISYISNAQNVSLSIDKKPSLVQCIPNPISILGKNCNDYLLTSNNGKIEQSNSDCKFVIYPNHVGLAKISITNKSGKLISEEHFQVKPVVFSVDIPNFKNYITDVEYFSKSAKLKLNSDDLKCLDIGWSANFELIIIAANKTTKILGHASNGSLNVNKEHFETLKKGNIIIFHNIKVIAGVNEYNVLDIVLEVN